MDTNNNNDQIQFESSTGDLSSGSNTKKENKMAPSDSDPLKEKDELQPEDNVEKKDQEAGTGAIEVPPSVPDPVNVNPEEELTGSAEQKVEPEATKDPSKEPPEKTSGPDVSDSSDIAEEPNKEIQEDPASNIKEPIPEQEAAASVDKVEEAKEPAPEQEAPASDDQVEEAKEPVPEKEASSDSPGIS